MFNATGQPALSLPLGWPDDGLPRGVQFVAAYGREDVLVRVGAQLEQAAPWAHAADDPLTRMNRLGTLGGRCSRSASPSTSSTPWPRPPSSA